MDATDWTPGHQILAGAGITIADGLTDTELQRAEDAIGGRLPPDLRAFLSRGLPVGKDFPDWREPSSAAIRERLDWPFEGISFDIEQNAFWLDEWGPRPASSADAAGVARQHVAAAPRLVPIYAHRYLPADPCLSGNPVFSVYQTDVIYYGADLTDYLRREFLRPRSQDAVEGTPRNIRFWSDLVEGRHSTGR